MVIPCLSSFLLTVLRTPAVELPVNKKRTRTLFHKESGSSTNCMVDGTGLEPEFIPDTAANSKHRATHGGLPQSLFHR